MWRKINRHSPEYVVWYKEGKKVWVWKANLLRKNSADATKVSADLKSDMKAMATWFRFVIIVIGVVLLISLIANAYFAYCLYL